MLVSLALEVSQKCSSLGIAGVRRLQPTAEGTTKAGHRQDPPTEPPMGACLEKVRVGFAFRECWTGLTSACLPESAVPGLFQAPLPVLPHPLLERHMASSGRTKAS